MKKLNEKQIDENIKKLESLQVIAEYKYDAGARDYYKASLNTTTGIKSVYSRNQIEEGYSITQYNQKMDVPEEGIFYSDDHHGMNHSVRVRVIISGKSIVVDGNNYSDFPSSGNQMDLALDIISQEGEWWDIIWNNVASGKSIVEAVEFVRDYAEKLDQDWDMEQYPQMFAKY